MIFQCEVDSNMFDVGTTVILSSPLIHHQQARCHPRLCVWLTAAPGDNQRATDEGLAGLGLYRRAANWFEEDSHNTLTRPTAQSRNDIHYIVRKYNMNVDKIIVSPTLFDR